MFAMHEFLFSDDFGYVILERAGVASNNCCIPICEWVLVSAGFAPLADWLTKPSNCLLFQAKGLSVDGRKARVVENNSFVVDVFSRVDSFAPDDANLGVRSVFHVGDKTDTYFSGCGVLRFTSVTFKCGDFFVITDVGQLKPQIKSTIQLTVSGMPDLRDIGFDYADIMAWSRAQERKEHSVIDLILEEINLDGK